MAVGRMSRVTVIAHRPALDGVVAALQRAGVLELSSRPETLEAEKVPIGDERLRRLDEYHADAHFVHTFLSEYHVYEAPFSAFVAEKIHIGVDEFEALQPDLHFRRVYRECESIADRLAAHERERERLTKLVDSLAPWQQFPLQIKDWRGTERTAFYTGTVPSVHGPRIRQELRESFDEITVEELGPVGSRAAWVVMVHHDRFDEVRAQLALTDFEPVSFPGLTDYPAEEISRAQDRIAEIDAERAQLEAKARELASEHYRKATALAEALHARREAMLAREEFGGTERAFVINGWVSASRIEDLEAALAPWHDQVDVTFQPPGPGDDPPVVLENPRWLRPFETLTDLYGRPRYHEIDPTPLLAPFFLLFFALCIGDFGYGAVLLVAAWLIKTRLDVAAGVKRFMDLIMWGGAGSMVVGVAFGSYLAFDFERLPGFLQALRILDPLEHLQTFLVATIVLGVVQVFFGVLVAAWDAARRGDPARAIMEQLSTVIFFVLLAVAFLAEGAAGWAVPVAIGLTVAMKGRTFEAPLRVEGVPAWDRAVYVLWLAAFAGSILAVPFGRLEVLWLLAAVSVVGPFVSKTTKAGVIGALGGAYAVYGMTSFLGDVLSYTRLAALGLASLLVGMVFNLLAGLVWSSAAGMFASGGMAVVGGAIVVVLALAVFAVGHAFNILINLLGAFVHPARLQFVEFFSKFYEGGGRAFSPFRYETTSLVLHAGATRQEGGTRS